MQGTDYWNRRMNYWRSWTPDKQIVEEHAKAEPTKPTKLSSVGSVSSRPGSGPIISPEAWTTHRPSGSLMI